MASDAALATLDHIWSVLEPLGHPLAVMGGMSLAAWNYIRATRDVDLLISVDRSGIDPILNALGAHGCRPKKSPPILSVGQHSLVQLLYTPPGKFYDVQFDLRNGNRSLSPVDEDDLDQLMLTRSKCFQAILNKSRRNIAAGKGLSKNDFWRTIRSRHNG